MAAKKKPVKKTVAKKKPVVKKVIMKAKDYYYVVASWTNQKGHSGNVSRVHIQDKGTPFNIFQAQNFIAGFVAQHTGVPTGAILINFMPITKNVSDLYDVELKGDNDRRLEAQAKIKADQDAAAAEAAKNAPQETPAMPEATEAPMVEPEREADVLPMNREENSPVVSEAPYNAEEVMAEATEQDL